ncbi:MAG TPA: tetratricopeptide repeat protein [Candidatus Peregrinibacteria bacterium]|nr:tetratricopeptide repeat protein [Candidatus Peregrinibacteria bacterium]
MIEKDPNSFEPESVATQRANRYLESGTSAEQIGDDKEAINCYLEALKFAENAEAHYRLACLYRKQHRPKEAGDHCCAAMAINPNHAGAFSLFSSVIDEKELEAPGAEEAKRKDPSGTWIKIGLMFDKNNNLKAAEESYRKAIKIDPGLAKTHFLLAKAFCKLEDYAKARLCLSEYQRLGGEEDPETLEFDKKLEEQGY